MRNLSASIMLLIASVPVLGQNRIISFDPSSANFDPKYLCPVQFIAQRQSIATIRSAGDERSHDLSSEALHVAIKHYGGPSVLSLEATLHAVPSDPRILPIGADPSDLTKTFQIQLAPGKNDLTSFDVSMPGVGSLRWLDVTSIAYSNGTSWYASSKSECRAIPSSFVLLGNKQ
jgi:hypothetical protein